MGIPISPTPISPTPISPTPVSPTLKFYLIPLSPTLDFVPYTTSYGKTWNALSISW